MDAVKTVTVELEVKKRLGRLKREMSLQWGRKCSYSDVLRYLLGLAEGEAGWRDIRR
ncbi:hypothetical protein [Candidatus Hecatella orcuttiae]|uniref:hypothetical protein n=1 Tax=Candidatus Hecatella orcuttiae TaxID=1935119 RepID=UPI002867B640|nr:hypothetical protein [Candidatus Hecatella orcuttiae]